MWVLDFEEHLGPTEEIVNRITKYEHGPREVRCLLKATGDLGKMVQHLFKKKLFGT